MSTVEEQDDSVYNSSDVLDDSGYDQAAIPHCPLSNEDQYGEFDVKCIDENHSLQPIFNPDMVCKDHIKPFIMVCVHCERPCCTVCIANKHSAHPFKTIEDAAKDARSRLHAPIENQKTTTLAKLENTQRASATGLDQYKRSMQMAKKKSTERFVTLHKQLEKMEKEWIQRLEKVEADDITKMKALHDITMKQLRSKKRFIDSCKNTHANVSDLEAILLTSGGEDDKAPILTELSCPPLVNFKLSNYKLPEMDMLVGDIKFTPESEVPSNSSFTLNTKKASFMTCSVLVILLSIVIYQTSVPLNTGVIEFLMQKANSGPLFDRINKSSQKMAEVGRFRESRIPFDKVSANIMAQTTILRSVELNIQHDSLLFTNNNEVWAYDISLKTLTLYDTNFTRRQSIEVQFRIRDMVFTSSNDIITLDYVGQRVVRISRAGDVIIERSTYPYYPRGICINNKQQIVVTLSLSPDHEILLAFYSPDGSTKLYEVNLDIIGDALFNGMIWKLGQNGNGDYVIAHSEGVSSVNSDVQFIWIYDNIDAYIYEFVCDKYNNIILAEPDNNKITLLDSNGKLIKTLLVELDGIRRPQSLWIDKQDNLWIGQTDDIKVVKYLKEGV